MVHIQIGKAQTISRECSTHFADIWM